MNKRLDIAIQERGIVKSRSKAQDLVKRGLVTVNKKLILKPSTLVEESDEIVVRDIPRFVGRGGEKLEAGLIRWDISVRGMTIADVGSSTGGFTDCLLSRGAKKVYAIDVGTDQLDATLRSDPRVVVMEKTDVRKVILPELVDIAVVDISFISLTLVMSHVARLVRYGGELVVLVKPQFEVGRDEAKKTKGVVSDTKLHTQSIERVKEVSVEAGLIYIDILPSPIEGGDGNKEFLLYLKK
jgi:23S rRNA (cytidine1920-2'-O)/16S rRNA (cytidine1409-2'-O)-methyltransferase